MLLIMLLIVKWNVILELLKLLLCYRTVVCIYPEEKTAQRWV